MKRAGFIIDIKSILATSIVVFILLLNFTQTTFASEEYIIDGNGQNSSNNINVSGQSTNQVQQSNDANIETDLSPDANTGGNQASGNNSEEVEITTGDATANSTTYNQANSSSAEVGCCSDSDTKAEISGNGSDSESDLNLNLDNSTDVTISNNVNIKTNITGYINTGNNKADDNTGNVSITTGNIFISAGIINKSINTALVTGGISSEDILISVSGNGTGSLNTTGINKTSAFDHNINNIANIINILDISGNTGGNSASGNNGVVIIKTGDIIADLFINNSGINTSVILADCGCGIPPILPPDGGTNVINPDNPGSSNNTSSSNTPADGAVLGIASEAVAQIFPVTGSSDLYLYTILALLMLGFGLYLRFYEDLKQKTKNFIFRY